MSAKLPAVVRDEASAAFFEAAARDELLLKRGPSGTVLAPEARTDPITGSSDLQPWVATGAGTLVSWAVVHRAPLPALAASVPYVSAIVELAEGPWLMVRLLADDPTRLRVGDPVRARFERSGDDDEGEVIPVFELESRCDR
ncbi:Zn-ribbon domain-containing OB-fold protein [Mycobacterium triplex]|uniref:Acyl dehydratase n=1 Tax=Mycobacterium triplex TaxID=47839 RepID=A0A024K385_9MYCO|nr:OB-fold domain-containing protein [Mycobacterium triplex]CDO90249.1 acyl dehydratase [Mycobacterium triplex]